MKKRLLIVLGIILFSTLSIGQNRMWNEVSENKLVNLEKMERISNPLNYKIFSLNLNQLKQELISAPKDVSGVYSNVIIDFPNSNGELESYRVYEAPVMEQGLADKFPNIKSYVALGINDKTSKLRFSITLFGLHSMSLSGATGTYYIDTFTKDLNNYIIYNRKDVQGTRTFGCLVQDDHEQVANEIISNKTVLASDGLFRQYRLAMACTIEYAAFHVNAAGLGSGTLAQKKAAVLSAMNVTMTRVNGVYERDMSLRMNLVANNDLVIFIDADNFDNNTASTLINQSQTVIDGAIGFSNYDIGHTVSTGGGGLAQLNSPCTGNKARGITGSPAPVGDPFDIDYVAHEMGHQFGGTHTFNNSCSNNRSSGTAVEPGSGSTIMAYAGICAPNVQNNSDAHFHAVSLAQMASFVAGTGSCAATTTNNNNAPVVNAGADFTIPKGTPFILYGSATDANGDALTYCWEQTDTQISTQPPLQTNASGPNFRSNPPIASPNRFMPAMSSVLQGNLAPTWEVVSNVARTMNFALTVRDNRMPNGGQTGIDQMILTVSGTTGPFDVTSQNTDQLVWAQGSSQTITWTVNGTTSLVGSTNVDILLSTDGGLTYATTLASNTPNDGTEVITVPSVTFPNCRVMVKPTGNIYYDINSKNIAIGNYTYQTQNVCTDYVLNAGTAIPESSTSYSGFALTIADSFTLTDINIRPNLTHPNAGNLYFAYRHPSQTSGVTRLSSGSCAGSANINLFYDQQGTAVNCAATTSMAPTLPLDPFTPFIGLNSSGQWIFYLVDIVVGDGVVGTFNNVTFNLCGLQTTIVLETESFGLTDFALYPNPNNGNFTVQFNSESSNDINVTVHDLRGRQVFANSFQNNGLFNQELKLNNTSSGIYLVTVQDGNRKEVKKIVVE
jgi:hypothetical protein